MKLRSRATDRESAVRITILAMGSRGDVQPYLGLALGLKDVGYEVVFAAYTNFAAEAKVELPRSRGRVASTVQDMISGKLYV